MHERLIASVPVTGNLGFQGTVDLYEEIVTMGTRNGPVELGGGIKRRETNTGFNVNALADGTFLIVQTGEILTPVL